MRTIIHIGQHKTGTTSLQHYLKNSRETLLKKGLYIPDSLAGIDHPSHYILNVYSLDKNRYSPMKERLLKTKSAKFFEELEEKLNSEIEKHYKHAEEQNCSDIIWTNEGLYLLNSVTEYERLIELFSKYSNDIVCVCSFREKDSYRDSYIKQLAKQNISHSRVQDSYRHIEPTSWLFNYDGKKELLKSVFKKTIFITYNPEDMTKTFMVNIGYDSSSPKQERLNITNST